MSIPKLQALAEALKQARIDCRAVAEFPAEVANG